jgi:formate dehydrogenase major subunit
MTASSKAMYLIGEEINVLSEIGESPLPRINSRFGHPTPQNGVEVERKWKRPDYASPGNGLVQLQTKR